MQSRERPNDAVSARNEWFYTTCGGNSFGRLIRALIARASLPSARSRSSGRRGDNDAALCCFHERRAVRWRRTLRARALPLRTRNDALAGAVLVTRARSPARSFERPHRVSAAGSGLLRATRGHLHNAARQDNTQDKTTGSRNWPPTTNANLKQHTQQDARTPQAQARNIFMIDATRTETPQQAPRKLPARVRACRKRRAMDAFASFRKRRRRRKCTESRAAVRSSSFTLVSSNAHTTPLCVCLSFAAIVISMLCAAVASPTSQQANWRPRPLPLKDSHTGKCLRCDFGATAAATAAYASAAKRRVCVCGPARAPKLIVFEPESPRGARAHASPAADSSAAGDARTWPTPLTRRANSSRARARGFFVRHHSFVCCLTLHNGAPPPPEVGGRRMRCRTRAHASIEGQRRLSIENVRARAHELCASRTQIII